MNDPMLEADEPLAPRVANDAEGGMTPAGSTHDLSHHDSVWTCLYSYTAPGLSAMCKTLSVARGKQSLEDVRIVPADFV